MSANAETQTPQQPVKKSGKRKRLLLLLISKKPMTHTWQGIRFKLCLRCLAA